MLFLYPTRGILQQSRFLALVSSGDRLTELSEKAADSQNEATLQMLKTMDSIEAKSQQLTTSLQSLYTSSGVQNLFKGILDLGNNIIQTFTKMPTTFNLPILAIVRFGTQFYALANIVTTVFTLIRNKLSTTATILAAEERNQTQQSVNERVSEEELGAQKTVSIWQAMANEFKAIQAEMTGDVQKAADIRAKINRKVTDGVNKSLVKGGLLANAAGGALTLASASIKGDSEEQLRGKGALEGAGALLQGIGTGAMMGGGIPGAIVGALTALPGIISGVATAHENAAEKAERLKKAVEDTNNAYLQRHDELKTLQEQADKFEELAKAQYNSKEAREEFLELSNTIAAQHPELITAIDAEGNAIVNLSDKYFYLEKARKAAIEAAQETAMTSYEEADNAEQEARKNADKRINEYIYNARNLPAQAAQPTKLTDILAPVLTASGKDLSEGELFTIFNQHAAYNDLQGFRTAMRDNFGYATDDIFSKEIIDKLAAYYNSLQENSDNLNDTLSDENVQLNNLLKQYEGTILGDVVLDIIEQNQEELKKILINDNGTLNEENIKELQDIRDNAEDTEDTYTQTVIDGLIDLANQISIKSLEVAEATNNTENVTRSGIVRVVGESLIGLTSDYLEEMSKASEFINEAVYQSYDSKQDLDTFLKNVPAQVENYDKQLSEIWKNLTPSEKTNFNQLIENSGHYSKEKFQAALNEYIAEDDALNKAIVNNVFNKVYSLSDFTQAIDKLDTDFDTTQYQSILDQVGSQDLLAILDIYKNVDKQIQNKTISADRGNDLIAAYMNLYATASKFDEDAVEANKLISGMSDFSLDGIAKFKESVNNSGLSKENIESLNNVADGLKKLIPVNLNTEINTFISSATEGMGDFESALSKATKGMNYKDAAEIAAKMGTSVSNFKQVGTKFFIDDLNALKDAYIKVDKELLTIIDGEINSVGQALKNVLPETLRTGEITISSSGFNSEAQLAAITKALDNQNVNINAGQLQLAEKYEEWLAIPEETRQDFVDYIIESLKSDIEEAKKIEEFVNTQIAENYLANGDFSNFLNNLNLTENQRNEYQKYFDEGNFDQLLEIFPQYADTIVSTFKNISTGLLNRITSASSYDNYISVDSTNASSVQQLVDAELASYIYDSNGKITGAKLAELTEENIDEFNNIIDNLPLTPSEKAKSAADATESLYEDSLDKIVDDITKNSKSVSAETAELMRRQLIAAFGIESGNKKFDQLFKDNGGTYEANINDLQDILKYLWWTLSDKTRQAAKVAVQKTADDLIKEISTATSLLTKGTDSNSDKQTFVDRFKELTGKTISIGTAFNYNELLRTDTLDYSIYQEYIQADARALGEAKGLVDEELDNFIEEYLVRQGKNLAKEVDIKSFLGAKNKDEGSKAYETLVSQMRNFYANAGKTEEEAQKEISKSIGNIVQGGQGAVDELLTWAEKSGEEVSEEDIAAVYRADMVDIENALEQLGYGVGSIVSGQAKEILQNLTDVGWGLEEIEGTDSAVIKVIGDVAVAYLAYYDKLVESGKATKSALNEAMAKVLEARDGTDIIDALGDAAGMTYTRLGEILAVKGIDLTEDFVEQYSDAIQSIGGGKVRIINFDKFATEIMGWTDIDTSSEEYISAFKTYNDALIELNRKTEKNIIEEIQSLSEASQGDQINLTQLVSALNAETDAALTEKLATLGATLKDGILTLNNDANIYAIIQTLTNEAAKNGLILEDSMAELADTLNDVLQSYTDLISSGITGKLSNAGMQSLQAQAKSLGYIGKLDFRKTANGLKLSDESAYQLYTHLKSIDSLKAGLVFEELADSITSSNANLKTMSGTMAAITRTQNKIKSNEAEIAALRANSNNSSRINQLNRENAKLKEQLNLYQQITQRQMGDPDSYNFMNQELPEIFQGAENYWNSVGNAFKAMNEAGESGKISIQDFYNIANEMNNLATLSGNTLEFMGQKLDGSAESAATLIQKGFSALSNIDSEGVAIDLNKLGVDFKNGADDMQVGFQEGIQSMAKSQIAMLDAQIQLLETIVAMEKLGEIDSNGDGIFQFIKEELGTLDAEGYIETFGEGYNRAKEALKKYFTETDNEDLKNAYKNVKICGHTIEELLNASETDLRNWGVKGEILQKLLQGLWDLSQSGDFDPQNIMASITSLLAELGLEDLEFSVDTGDMTVVVNSTGDFQIDWESANAQAAMEVFGEEVANKRDALQTALNNYIAGKTDATELKAALTYKGIVSANIEKPDHTIVDGISYPNGSSELEVAIAKAALKDVGATEISSTYNEEMGTVEATGSIKIGNKKVQVINDGSKTTYHSTMTGQDYGTVAALRDAEYSYALDQFYKGYRENPGTKEQFEAIEYGIPIEFNPTIETKLNTNALREQALEIARTPVNIIQEAIDSNKIDRQVNDDGTVTYDFSGIKVTVANKGSVEQRVAAAQQELVNMVDPDGMITKIAAGIQSAFTDDENTIGNAIGNGIVNALKTADFSDKNFEVPEAEATLSKLDITDVESAEMTQSALASMFGVKNNTLSLDEATAKISKLVISGADSTDFSAIEQNSEKQSNLTIPEATADLTTLKLGEIGEIDSSNIEDKAESVGENLGEGIITGTENKKEEVTNAGKALGEAAVEGTNDGAQTDSPSKATEQTGKDLVSGLVVGMSDTSAAVAAAQTLAQTVIQTIQNYFNSNPIAISTSIGTNTSTPQTPSADTAGLAAVQAAIASISAAGQAATASITTLNNNLNNISDNGAAKAADFQAALNKITDVGKTKAENFQTALAAIGNNGQLKAEAFQAALSKIGNNGYLKATAFQSALSKISNIGAERANAFRDALKSIGQTGITRANSFASAVNGVGSYGVSNSNNFRNALNGISRSGPDHAANFKKALNSINQTTLKINVKVTTTGASAQVTGNLNPWWSWAKGNVSSSNSHIALAGGKAKTLMGELGPELVVSNGRYFLVGENGPEMVDLADDAIVFNHLQTKKLMKNGSVNTHGQPVSNEKKATSMATGSFAGDAFASASEALAYLKQLREMWRSLLGASAKELGALAGKGRGSGGSGGGSDTDPSGTSERSTTADIERWYNLLRQIDKLEQDITYQQQLQNKLTSDRNTNGRALYNSYKAELDALDQEIAKSRELATIQKSWYDAKRRELNNSEYSKIFTYDENGLQQYTQGRGRGLDILEHLTATDANGQPVRDAATASSQLAYLKRVGFNIDSLLVGNDGSRVAYRGTDGKLYDKDNKELTDQELADAQASMMENFWDNVDGWKDEMDSLYDSYHEQEQNILEAEQHRNEILQKLVDNQLSLEQTILKAVEDIRQAEIDNLQDERDAYEESVNKMVAGLNESLSNERKMYEAQQDNTELNRLQRQLALLQRTGGSGASIRSLQEQIESKQQDVYFTERQNEIDAIQEAADRQIERLDEQINIMTETLAYQKENGLLWKDVYTVMQGTPAEIADFITANAQEWSSKSTLAQSEDLRALKQIIETYTAQRDDPDNPTNEEDDHDWNVFAEANKNRYKDVWRDGKDNAKEIFDKKLRETGDSNQASRATTDYLNQKMRSHRAQQVEPEVEEVEIVLGDDFDDRSRSSGGGFKSSGSSGEGSDGSGGSQGQPSVQQATLSPKEKAQKYGKQVAAAIWEYPGGSGWGNGGTRKKNITAKGMDYSTVQSYVNQMTKKNRKQRLSMAGLSSVSELAPYTFSGFAFKNGGLIDYTGPAWVDGSPSKPEYILNAEQTAALRKQLISSKTSHQNLIGEAISAADKIANTSTSTNNSTITDNSIGINNLNFTMQVAKIADDYDAKKAGEKVINEMVRIARKNGDRSISRR